MIRTMTPTRLGGANTSLTLSAWTPHGRAEPPYRGLITSDVNVDPTV